MGVVVRLVIFGRCHWLVRCYVVCYCDILVIVSCCYLSVVVWCCFTVVMSCLMLSLFVVVVCRLRCRLMSFVLVVVVVVVVVVVDVVVVVVVVFPVDGCCSCCHCCSSRWFLVVCWLSIGCFFFGCRVLLIVVVVALLGLCFFVGYW